MKLAQYPFIAAVLLLLLIGLPSSLSAAETTNAPAHQFEYVTIHWDGRDNTHIIQPNGEVKSLGDMLTKIKKPNRTEDRAFYMNIVMNSLAKEGYKFVGIRDNDIVMQRPAAR
jgi:hypothetical protein